MIACPEKLDVLLWWVDLLWRQGQEDESLFYPFPLSSQLSILTSACDPLSLLVCWIPSRAS